jgi:F0F1-type ATP synthase delta subunit
MSRTARLTAEQRAEVEARVATWQPLTEAQRERVRALFEGHDLAEIRSN